ncbi:MAG TPA: M28 family peptidase, partial [Brevundimonas sp.]|nr:M28 family peptidase [Brevundimonas sp.]
MRHARLLALSTALGGALLLSACGSLFGPEATPPVAAAPAPSAMHTQLLEDVRILSADAMQGRDTGAPGGEMARNYIVGRLEGLGVVAPPMGRLQPWEMQGRTRAGPRTYNGVNVIGMIPGTRVTDRYIVVTAHYDHVGVNAEGQVFNGADDNASGVATMLALAADLKRQAPEHSVLIVALDGEEHGLLGAKHFV